jgi:hypothetical protein
VIREAILAFLSAVVVFLWLVGVAVGISATIERIAPYTVQRSR